MVNELGPMKVEANNNGRAQNIPYLILPYQCVRGQNVLKSFTKSLSHIDSFN